MLIYHDTKKNEIVENEDEKFEKKEEEKTWMEKKLNEWMCVPEKEKKSNQF